jgi:hypothetical protein
MQWANVDELCQYAMQLASAIERQQPQRISGQCGCLRHQPQCEVVGESFGRPCRCDFLTSTRTTTAHAQILLLVAISRL